MFASRRGARSQQRSPGSSQNTAPPCAHGFPFPACPRPGLSGLQSLPSQKCCLPWLLEELTCRRETATKEQVHLWARPQRRRLLLSEKPLGRPCSGNTCSIEGQAGRPQTAAEAPRSEASRSWCGAAPAPVHSLPGPFHGISSTDDGTATYSGPTCGRDEEGGVIKTFLALQGLPACEGDVHLGRESQN